jgi:uncharacterized protein YjaG (DUF416 family)
MPLKALNNVDDYERFLQQTLATWSPEQRTAFAAAMAERWLPVYEEFSAEEQWGDAASLRRTLDAVWQQVGGVGLTPKERKRHAALVEDCTPILDDFDAYEAMTACVMISEALECCGTADNTLFAVRAALGGLDAAAPEWVLGPEEQPRLWRRIAVRKELNKQLEVAKLIGAIARFDDRSLKTLREALFSPHLAGEVTPKTEVPSEPLTITNQVAFEQYRHMVELDLKSPSHIDWSGSIVNVAMMIFGAWLGRYGRRRNTIDGSYGRLADAAAQEALLRQQRALDAAETVLPDWHPDARMVIDLCFGNPMNRLDARAPDQPHQYGPSVRRLWAQAKRSGQTDVHAWQHILAWARHRPAAWQAEDERKKQGLAYANPALGERLARSLTWTATGDVEHPWSTRVGREIWRVSLNDFPDDSMYTLLIDDRDAGSFHDWPQTWPGRE